MIGSCSSRGFSPLTGVAFPGGTCHFLGHLTPVGKLNGPCHSVWEDSEKKMGCDLSQCNFFLYFLYLSLSPSTNLDVIYFVADRSPTTAFFISLNTEAIINYWMRLSKPYEL